MSQLPYSVVIATLGREGELDATLHSLLAQTRLPERIIVVDASDSAAVKACIQNAAECSAVAIEYQAAIVPGAATQRNQGASCVSTPLVAFIDDDMEVLPATCNQICAVFEQDNQAKIGGVSARMEGASHPAPKGLLWLYYRLQAGYPDETYGARLFGPAINCFPCFERSPEELIQADWLNSACVFYRTALFLKEQFPDFPGSSFMEDVHLSARIARQYALYFHSKALCIHRDGAKSASNTDHAMWARMRIENQRKVAMEILGTRHLAMKLWLHKLFVCVSILRYQPLGKSESILATLLA